MQAAESKNPGGRPMLYPDQRMIVISVRVTADMLRHLDDKAAARVERVDRSNIIRELIAADMGKGNRS